MNIFDHYRQRYEAAKDEEFTLQEFLTICRQDRSAYANAAERLLMAIGEPVMVDTALEPRLSRLFSNRVVARYPAFEEFYGMEEAIEQIVSYLKHAAQGLEEKKQILYLLGPVGGGKSSLAERLKSLMQRVPIYVLTADGEPARSTTTRCACSIHKKMPTFLTKNMAYRAAIWALSCRPGPPSVCTISAVTSPVSKS